MNKCICINQLNRFSYIFNAVQRMKKKINEKQEKKSKINDVLPPIVHDEWERGCAETRPVRSLFFFFFFFDILKLKLKLFSI